MQLPSTAMRSSQKQWRHQPEGTAQGNTIQGVTPEWN